MRISEKAQQIEKRDFFLWMINKKTKNIKLLILINVQNIFLINPFLLKEYNLFSQNTESSLEQ